MDPVDEHLLKLYELLRAEIQNDIQLNNKISLFSFTITAAVLSFGVASNKPSLCLMPMLLILPLAAKSTYYRRNQLTIASCLSIKLEPELEGISWESDLRKLPRNLTEIIFLGLRNYEFVFEAFTCLLLYIYLSGLENVSVFLLSVSLLLLSCFVALCVLSSMRSRNLDRISADWESILCSCKRD